MPRKPKSVNQLQGPQWKSVIEETKKENQPCRLSRGNYKSADNEETGDSTNKTNTTRKLTKHDTNLTRKER